MASHSISAFLPVSARELSKYDIPLYFFSESASWRLKLLPKDLELYLHNNINLFFTYKMFKQYCHVNFVPLFGDRLQMFTLARYFTILPILIIFTDKWFSYQSQPYTKTYKHMTVKSLNFYPIVWISSYKESLKHKTQMRFCHFDLYTE